MPGPVSVALFRTWSVGGVAPGHTRADKLRRSSCSQALCKSTSTHRGRHTGFCVGEHRQCVPATTARHRRSSQNLLSTHCSWLVLVRLQPLRLDIGSLPLLNIFFFFGLTGCGESYKLPACHPHFSKRTNLCKRKACKGPGAGRLRRSVPFYSAVQVL